jgi:cell division protein FtsZ
MDLAIDEVTTISSIIQEAAGEEAEIIFGAVHDSALEEEIRVTVIATGFDKSDFLHERSRTAHSPPTSPRPAGHQPGLSLHGTRLVRPSTPPVAEQGTLDLQIPTFIRRQMD